MWLSEHNLCPRDIVTKESFENLIMVHGAISGSTNSLLHIPAIAREFGIEMSADDFDRLHRGAHYLLNVRPAGEWPAQFFYYAGGVPRIMEEIKSMLHLDVMTVTGKTLGENLEDLKNNGYYEKCGRYLEKWNLKRETSFARLTRLLVPTAPSPSSTATLPPRAPSSSTRLFRARCSRPRLRPVRSIARRTPSTPS